MDLSPILNALAPSNPTPATVRRARAPGKILHRLPQDEIVVRAISSIAFLRVSLGFRGRFFSSVLRTFNAQSSCNRSRRIAYREEWPFAIHLLGHICANDLLPGFFCRPNALQTWLDIRFIIQKMVDCEEGVKKPKIITEQNLDPNKLQRLTVSFPF
ncbi:hypothetical protein GW17_00021241 [Ensete ventricosum]|nr:hypothetical protein GW17_00021241 [Ensete ventricosum]